MITIASDVQGRRIPHEFFGLSTDVKPTGCLDNKVRVTNGSMFIEMDTKKMFLFDEENQTWIEQ